MEATCFIKKEGNQYASLCVELDVASCGKTKKEAFEGLRRAIESYVEYMISEGREKEIYRPVPMSELKQFLFPEHEIEEKTFKSIPLTLQLQYA
ncbi:MAG: hypothetical protein SV062_03630 [Thermodesulfobacteriota bacterium]|nr:hypothetical protein [Thermodesulfobacteriota bacterium]